MRPSMSCCLCWVAAVSIWPAAALQTEPRQAPQHIPTGFLVFESEHYMGQCSVKNGRASKISRTRRMSSSALPLHKKSVDWTDMDGDGAASDEDVDEGEDWMEAGVDFSGLWRLRKMTGEVDQVMLSSGLNPMNLALVKSMSYGAGYLTARITQRGNQFNIKTMVLGVQSEEMLHYEIDGAASRNVDATRCAHWTNETKTEFVLEAAKHDGTPIPRIYRYMNGKTMMMRVTDGLHTCWEYWDRMDAYIQDMGTHDPTMAEVVNILREEN